jgi:hypothetical protein
MGDITLYELWFESIGSGVWRGATGCKSHRLYWPTVKFDGGRGGVPFLSWLLIAFNINKQSYPQLSLTDFSIFQIRRCIALPYIVTYYRWREMGDITLYDLWFEYVPHSTLLGWISRTYHFWFGLYLDETSQHLSFIFISSRMVWSYSIREISSIRVCVMSSFCGVVILRSNTSSSVYLHSFRFAGSSLTAAGAGSAFVTIGVFLL